jgi:hypothetical protein
VVFDSGEPPVRLTAEMTRDEVIAHVESLRGRNVSAELAFYAWRDLGRTPSGPFVKAAMERNPVSRAGSAALTEAEVVSQVLAWPDESIYDGATRLAQPDEVWNYRRGDGFEKALLVANVLRGRGRGALRIELAEGRATLFEGERQVCSASSSKAPAETVWTV